MIKIGNTLIAMSAVRSHGWPINKACLTESRLIYANQLSIFVSNKFVLRLESPKSSLLLLSISQAHGCGLANTSAAFDVIFFLRTCVLFRVLSISLCLYIGCQWVTHLCLLHLLSTSSFLCFPSSDSLLSLFKELLRVSVAHKDPRVGECAHQVVIES